MKNPFLIGTQIYLRPLEREHAAMVATWLNDPEVTRTLLIHRPLSLHAELEYIETHSNNEHELTLMIAIKQTDRLIGVLGLHQMDFKNRHVNFGIAIGEKDAWGKGYGTEAAYLAIKYAFETLNMNRVWLHVQENNPQGIRSYEKVGFKREGILRQEGYREGRYWDTISMAILREEWETPMHGKP